MPAPAPVVYEVHLSVDREIAEAYANWLGPHIAEMLCLDGFMGAEWFDVEPETIETDRVQWCVQYRLTSREALQVYFEEQATRLRSEGLTRFAGRFEATRRVLLAHDLAPR